MQTSEQLAAFRALCQANNLGKSDVWQHKESNNWIISRPGIEKIQGLNNITVALDYCGGAAEFAVVKATATRTVKPEGAKTGKKLSVESLGSANAKNSQVSYYAEMAEKRAKSRSVLMLMGFYALGVYGEDEADDFKRTADSGTFSEAAVAAPPKAVQSMVVVPEAPKKAPAGAAAPDLAPPAPSVGAAPSPGLNVELEAAIQKIIGLIRHHQITPGERSRMMRAVNGLTLAKAQDYIIKIEKLCEFRSSPKALQDARAKFVEFAEANATALGQATHEALLLRSKALTVTAVDLLTEIEQAWAGLGEGKVAA